MTEAVKLFIRIASYLQHRWNPSERMQESFHGLLVNNSDTSSIPVRPPFSLSLSPALSPSTSLPPSLSLPLSRDLAHLLRIAFNSRCARRSPPWIRPVLSTKTPAGTSHPSSTKLHTLPRRHTPSSVASLAAFLFSLSSSGSVLTASSPCLCAAVSPLQPG